MARRATATRALRALDRIRGEFGGDLAARKLALLASLERASLATAREVLSFHDSLCFMRSYPDSRELRSAVERMLGAFERRADLKRHANALEDSGIAGTRIRFRFFHPMARWLAARWPDRLHIDWSQFDDTARLEHFLPLFASAAESPALDEFDFGLRGWLDRLKAPRESDAAFLARGLAEALPEPARERLWDDLDLPFTLEPGKGTPSRTHAFAPRAPRAFQRGPLHRKRPVLADELARPPLAVRALTPAAGGALIDLARAAMVTRSRDLDAFSYGDPQDVRLADCGDGLAFACIGVLPERRLLLESVYAFLTLKNGVPIGYVLSSALFGSAEIAYNVFETWRGAEAGAVYGRALATVKHVFGVDAYTIYPYQLGQNNDEALESGAWWFYQKLGFRARDPKVLKLMRAELAHMARRPRHRSSIAALRVLADENVYYHEGAEREDVIGILPLANVGLHVTRVVRERFDGDRARAEQDSLRVLEAMPGGAALRAIHGRAHHQVRAWALLIASIPNVERWSGDERKALIEVVAAKAGRRESDFVRRFDAHAKLCGAIRAMALDDLSG